MEKSGTKREVLPDLLKAFAIILVVWGHAVQYCHGAAYDFKNDWVYALIYGFHMPLFMLISGYLFVGTVKRYGVLQIIAKKAKNLLLPSFFWGVIMVALDVIATPKGIEIGNVVGSVVIKTLTNFWFLKAVFVASIITLLIEKCFKGNKIVYAVACLLGMFAPDAYNLQTIGMIFTFFAMGYVYGNGMTRYKPSARMFVASIIGYLVTMMAYFWVERYVWPHSALEWLLNTCMYYVAGLTGSVGTIVGMTLLQSRFHDSVRAVVQRIGKKTMVIYILSTMLFAILIRVMKFWNINLSETAIQALVYDFLLLPISLLLIMACGIIEKIVDKSRILSMLMFGKGIEK